MTAEELQRWLDEHPHLRDTDAYHRVEARLAALTQGAAA